MLLHAYRHPEHEHAVARAAQALPDVHVSLSHQVVGTFREFERASTTEVDAALSPLLAGYLRRLVERCEQAGVPEPAIMQSNGGLIDLESAAGHAAWTVLSGPREAPPARPTWPGPPAPRTRCASTWAAPRATSAWSTTAPSRSRAPARSPTGRWRCRWWPCTRSARAAARSPGAIPAARCASGRARRAPTPGPACYGPRRHRADGHRRQPGARLSVRRRSPLAGGVELDAGAARDAIAQLAERLGLEPLACAEGIIRVANAEMVRALRVVTVQRGIDPRRYVLLAFGGAGGLHAAGIARELGITEIVCPRASGVLAAVGLVVSPRRRDVQRSVFLGGDDLTAERIGGLVEELGAQARDELGEADSELAATYELRYRGQAFELAVGGPLNPDPDELRASFEAIHEERYGYHDAEQQLELVTLRVSATVAGVDVALTDADEPGEPERGEREATLDGERITFSTLRGLVPARTVIEGPCVVELPESTLLVPPGWTGAVDDTGTIHLRG